MADSKQEQEGPRWTYGLRSRPASSSALPTDRILGAERSHPAFRYGTVSFSNALSQDEIDRYELAPVSAIRSAGGVTEPLLSPAQSEAIKGLEEKAAAGKLGGFRPLRLGMLIDTHILFCDLGGPGAKVIRAVIGVNGRVVHDTDGKTAGQRVGTIKLYERSKIETPASMEQAISGNPRRPVAQPHEIVGVVVARCIRMGNGTDGTITTVTKMLRSPAVDGKQVDWQKALQIAGRDLGRTQRLRRQDVRALEEIIDRLAHASRPAPDGASPNRPCPVCHKMISIPKGARYVQCENDKCRARFVVR